MKIQIEPRKDIIDIKPASLEKITYVSYLHYQVVIPKAPEDVRLSDVKNTLGRKDDLEYHFKTKDLDGKIITIEVASNNQPIPLLDGEIKVETVVKQTEVCFRIMDEKHKNVIKNLQFGHLEHGMIPISNMKSKTLANVKEVLPAFLQKAFQEGKNIRYFFTWYDPDIGYFKKELVHDTQEVPGSKKIRCWIMVSPDVCDKLSQRTKFLLLLAIFCCLSFGYMFYYNSYEYLVPSNLVLGIVALPITLLYSIFVDLFICKGFVFEGF